MREALRPVFVIVRREVKDQFRDWRITVPIVILTLVFPLLMEFTATQMVNFIKSYNAQALVYERLIPFLLMIVVFFPTTVSLVIALESFSGESERRSIEPLLDSPLADWQLYLGKLLASMVVPLTASAVGLLLYLIGLALIIHWYPPPLLLLQIVSLAVIQALVMVSGAVVVSTQTTSVRAANLLASFIIIPMSLVVQGESVIMFWGNFSALWLAMLGQVVLAGLLIRTGTSHFNREELLGRELDTINLRWGWQIFRSTFIGQAHNLKEWWRLEVPASLRRLGIPFGMMGLLAVATILIGAWIAPQIPVSSQGVGEWLTDLKSGETFSQFRNASPTALFVVALLIWLNNLKSVALVSFLGIFSFGVLGVLGLMATMAIIGVMAAMVAIGGASPLLFLSAYILPHGILEIPALLLAGAAILRMGTTMVTPAHGQTIGEAWLRSLADWAKVVVGVVIPLFFVAALLEVYLTPQIALILLGN